MSEFNPIVIDIIRDDNETVRFNDTTSEWGIVSIMGLEFPEQEVFTEAKGLGDGLFVTGRRLNGRTVEIHLRAKERYLADVFSVRRVAVQFFQPSHTFTVRFHVYDSGTSQDSVSRVGQLTDAVLLAVSYPVIQANGAQEDLVLQFLAEDPFFTASADTVYTQAVTPSGPVFPLVYTGEGTVPFIISATITGGSSFEPYFWFSFSQAGSGSGESYQFRHPDETPFAVGDVLTLDTSNGIYTVNGVQAPVDAGEVSGIIDHWKIVPGRNNYGADSIGMNMTVQIRFRERYYSL